MTLAALIAYLNTHLLVAVPVVNIALSAVSQILSALGVVAPGWFDPLKKAIDWMSANLPHPTDAPKT